MQNWPCGDDQPRTEARKGGEEPVGRPAEGQPGKLAKIDIEAACRDFRRDTGSYRMENWCRDSQREALEELQGWVIPPEVLEHCNEFGRDTDSYRMLKWCVEREIRAKQAQDRP